MVAANSTINNHGQPVGTPLTDWEPRPHPNAAAMDGRWCRLERLDPVRHGPALIKGLLSEGSDALWTYLHYGPFETEAAFTAWLWTMAAGEDPRFYTIVSKDDAKAVGLAAYLNVRAAEGSLELGHLIFSKELQHTRAATEAMYLMLDRAITDWGYRRCEWKCDDLNAASKTAAERLGFHKDGVFRQSCIYKGRNRDTAWYSILGEDWTHLSQALSAWLEPDNFDENGRQRTALSDSVHALPAR